MIDIEKLTAAKNARLEAGLQKPYAKERRFKAYGIISLAIAFSFLATLLVSIISDGAGAFRTTKVQLTVTYDADLLGLSSTPSENDLKRADYQALVKQTMRDRFPDVSSRNDKKALYGLISNSAGYELRDRLMNDAKLLGKTETLWVLADDEVNSYAKGDISRAMNEDDRRFKNNMMDWIDELTASGELKRTFNWHFFFDSDSREPEQAGIGGAIIGSLFTLMVTLALSFPIGIAAAIYLEEFAPKNRITDIIEVNINNLAAVPSIVFGLLGAAIFINFAHLPRSAPLVGGLVLTLMTLPTIIISSRAAIKAVPPSIREAALGLGASKMQTVLHHVLPLALPGMLTGTIIGMAQALGETAPLLMIGMVAFVVDIPGSPVDPATALPVQIFMWADLPERAFEEKTSGAIMVLLGFLAFMNAAAVLLRKKFERRW